MQLKEVIEKLVAEKHYASRSGLTRWRMDAPTNDVVRNIYSTITGTPLKGYYWVVVTHEIIDSWINILETINEEDS